MNSAKCIQVHGCVIWLTILEPDSLADIAVAALTLTPNNCRNSNYFCRTSEYGKVAGNRITVGTNCYSYTFFDHNLSKAQLLEIKRTFLALLETRKGERKKKGRNIKHTISVHKKATQNRGGKDNQTALCRLDEGKRSFL